VTTLLDLLHFGDGPQAINYFILCFFAILGAIQFVAIRYDRRDLKWHDGQAGIATSTALIVGGFVWFFITDKEIFIPGLAGGELFTIFVAAFAIAVPTTRVLAIVFTQGNLIAARLGFAPRNDKEKEPMI
jgi:hypothetical protein